jgi:hypothetical protein
MLHSPDLARPFQVANTHSWVVSENSDKAIEGITPLISDRDGANNNLIQLKSQLQAGQPNSVVTKTVSKTEELLAASGASLVYAGYPFDPFA